MNSFTYQNPVKVVFGIGTFARAGAEAAKLGRKAFVVSYGDGSVAGTLANLRVQLDASGVASGDKGSDLLSHNVYFSISSTNFVNQWRLK